MEQPITSFYKPILQETPHKCSLVLEKLEGTLETIFCSNKLNHAKESPHALELNYLTAELKAHFPTWYWPGLRTVSNRPFRCGHSGLDGKTAWPQSLRMKLDAFNSLVQTYLKSPGSGHDRSAQRRKGGQMQTCLTNRTGLWGEHRPTGAAAQRFWLALLPMGSHTDNKQHQAYS